MSAYLIETQSLTKVYGSGQIAVAALNGVDIGIEPGEFVAIMGPSGSGKSTLMNILGCLDQPTAGNYILDNLSVSDLNKAELAQVRNHKIGFVFQSFNLLPRISAFKNVLLPMLYGGSRSPMNERRERTMDALEAVGLADRAHHRPNELSGGQRQRVAIARALVKNPSLFLADEPTGQLDSKSGEEVISILTSLHAEQGITLVVVTHDANIAQHCQRIIHLKDGEVVDEESV